MPIVTVNSAQPARTAPIRIIIADDQALVRRGAALLLSMEPDMEVVGQACNGVEAVELTESLHPDIVLMDLHMPVKSGVVATREITRAHPNTQVLVLTTLDDDETVFEAVRAGAHAYLLKDAEEHGAASRQSAALKRGESRLTPQIARKVMDQFRRLAQSAESASPRGGPREGGAHDGAVERKRGEGCSAWIAEVEQSADRRFSVPGRRNGQEPCQPHHGQASRQYQDRIGRCCPQNSGIVIESDQSHFQKMNKVTSSIRDSSPHSLSGLSACPSSKLP